MNWRFLYNWTNKENKDFCCVSRSKFERITFLNFIVIAKFPAKILLLCNLKISTMEVKKMHWKGFSSYHVSEFSLFKEHLFGNNCIKYSWYHKNKSKVLLYFKECSFKHSKVHFNFFQNGLKESKGIKWSVTFYRLNKTEKFQSKTARQVFYRENLLAMNKHMKQMNLLFSFQFTF